MPETKVEFFERAATYVLSLLYEQFPEKSTLDPRTLVAELENPHNQESSSSFEPLLTVSATISYLKDEGFIHGTERALWDGWSVYTGCRLSERGLKLLASVPATIDPDSDKRRPGERLADAVEKGKWGLASQLVRELLELRSKL